MHDVELDALPDGAYVVAGGVPHVVLGDRLLRWTAAGYVDPIPRPGGRAQAITPPSLLAVLHAGWAGAVPLIHPTGLPAAPRGTPRAG
jgi:hypothetical protein